VVLNLFAEGSQIQTHDLDREPHSNFLTQVIWHVLFYCRTKTVTQIILAVVKRLLRATQRVLGATCGPRNRG